MNFFFLLLNLILQFDEYHHVRKERFLLLYFDFRTMVEDSLRDRSTHLRDELMCPYRVAVHAFREKVPVGDVLDNAFAACLVLAFIAGDDWRMVVVGRYTYGALGHRKRFRVLDDYMK